MGSRAFVITFLLVIASALSLSASEFHLVKVPAGELVPFWMVPKSTKGQKTVKIKPYKVNSIMAMPMAVTKKQYFEFLNLHPEWKKENVTEIFADKTYLSNLNKSNENSPITEISWFAARAFCESNGMRLPTLQEWEYMAAASEKLKDANKDEVFLRRILDWYGEPSGGALRPTGSIYKSLYGLWDMHGLIWEWVEDFNTSFVTGESREDGNLNKNMFCGAGSMSSANKEDYAAFMRFAFRSSLKGNSSVWNLGFRCVRSL